AERLHGRYHIPLVRLPEPVLERLSQKDSQRGVVRNAKFRGVVQNVGHERRGHRFVKRVPRCSVWIRRSQERRPMTAKIRQGGAAAPMAPRLASITSSSAPRCFIPSSNDAV